MHIETPRGLIVPTDFQSMGFGVGAAIGAALAAPGREIVCITGDGGLAMSGTEILTAVRENLDLMIIVFNDGYLGQIRVEQLKEFGNDFGTSLGNLDIQLFAESVGATYFGLFQDFDENLHAAINLKGVRVVELPLRDSTHLRMQTIKRSVKNQVRSVPDIGKLLFMKRRLKRNKGK
jgi:acetolactate synthase-1/2/3 large subunit